MPRFISLKHFKSRDRTRRSSNEDGFTLLEMLVVMAIVMVVYAGLSNTIATRNNAPSLESMAKEVQTLVYQARADAIGSGELRSVWVDLDAKRFSYLDYSAVQLPKTVGLKITTGRELVSADGRIELVFLADGSSSGMDVLFTREEENPSNSSNKKTAKLRINWLTGLPSVLTQ